MFEITATSDKGSNIAVLTITTTEANSLMTVDILRKKNVAESSYEKVGSIAPPALNANKQHRDNLPTETNAVPSMPIINLNDAEFNFNTRKFTLPFIGQDQGSEDLFIYVLKHPTEDYYVSNEEYVRSVSGIAGYDVALSDKSDYIFKSSDRKPANYSVIDLTIDNPDKLQYLHARTVDTKNRNSETFSIPVDITPPTKVNEFWFNDLETNIDEKVMSFTTDRCIISSNASEHPRGFSIFYDIALVDSKSYYELAVMRNLTSARNVELPLKPLTDTSKFGPDKSYRIAIKTYTLFGSSRGWSYSKSFKIDFSDPTVVIKFDNSELPEFINAALPAENYKLKWTATGSTAEVNKVTGYLVYMRTRYSNVPEWSEWKVLTPNPITEKELTISKESMEITGYTVREFRIVGKTNSGNTRFFNNPRYLSDVAVLTGSNSTGLGIYIRLPIGAFNTLPGKPLVAETTISGKTFRSSEVNVDGNIISGPIVNNDYGFKTILMPSYNSGTIALKNGKYKRGKDFPINLKIYSERVVNGRVETDVDTVENVKVYSDGSLNMLGVANTAKKLEVLYTKGSGSNGKVVVDKNNEGKWYISSGSEDASIVKLLDTYMNAEKRTDLYNIVNFTGRDLNEDLNKPTKTVTIDPNNEEVWLVACAFNSFDKYVKNKELTFNFRPVPGSVFKQISDNPVRTTFKFYDVSVEVVKSYNLIKYGTLNKPNIGLVDNPEVIKNENNIKTYKQGIRVSASLNETEVLKREIEANTTIHMKYTTSSVNGSDVTSYNSGDRLVKPGYTSVYAKAVYKTEFEEIESEENSISFIIADNGASKKIPTFSNTVFGNGFTSKRINTGCSEQDFNDFYTYRFKNETTGTFITEGVDLVKSTVEGKVVFDIKIRNLGKNIITVLMSYQRGIEEPISDLFEVYNIGSLNEGAQLITDIQYHRHLPSNPENVAYNDATGVITNVNNVDKYYFMKINNKRYGMLPGYKIPVYDKMVIEAFGIWTPDSNRYRIMTEDSTETPAYGIGKMVAPETDNDGMRVVEKQRLDFSNQDDKSFPTRPLFSVEAEHRLTPFSPNGSGESVARNSIKVTVTNPSPLYEVKCFLNGAAWESGRLITDSGKHVFIAVFRNKYNYNLTYRMCTVEVIKDSMYSPPRINYTPKKKYSKYYDMEVIWTLSEQEANLRGGATYTKEYKLSTDNTWKTYTEPVRITQPCIFTAKKTLSTGLILQSSLEITGEMMIRQPVPNPDIKFALVGQEPNKAVYVPMVERHFEYNYSFKLNGVPGYIYGNPITNYDSSRRKYSLEVNISDKLTDKTRTEVIEFEIDTTLPKIPILSFIPDKSTERHILKPTLVIPDLRLNILESTREAGVDYTIIYDGVVVPMNYKLTPEQTKGIHSISIQAQRRDNKLISKASYYVDLKDSIHTDAFQTKEYNNNPDEDPNKYTKRIVLLPYNSNNNYFDTPGELTMDPRTGDIGIVSDQLDRERERNTGVITYKLIELTKDLRKDLKHVEAISEQIKRSNDLYKEMIKNHKHRRANIAKNNTLLNAKVMRVKAIADETKAAIDKIRRDVDALRVRRAAITPLINQVSSAENKNRLKGRFDRVDEIWNNDFASRKREFKDLADRILSVASLAAKSIYNIESIRKIVTPKVNKTDWEAFKVKQERFYQELAAKIKKF